MSWMPRLRTRRNDHADTNGAGGLTDEQAMGRVRSHGDPAAFARLVARWEAPLRRLCLRMTGDEHRGEDLAQEAFARVFGNRHRYAEGRRFSTWVWRIALNLCYEHARRSRVRETLPLDDRDRDDARGGAGRADAASGPPEHAAEAERAQLVRDALARLPEAQRTVVVLRQYENLKFREIAEVLDEPEGTVKWRMAEAMDRLAVLLAPLRGERDGADAGHVDRGACEKPTDPSDDDTENVDGGNRPGRADEDAAGPMTVAKALL